LHSHPSKNSSRHQQPSSPPRFLPLWFSHDSFISSQGVGAIPMAELTSLPRALSGLFPSRRPVPLRLPWHRRSSSNRAPSHCAPFSPLGAPFRHGSRKPSSPQQLPLSDALTAGRGEPHGAQKFFQRLPVHLPSPAAARPFLLFPSAAARSPCSDCSHDVQVFAQRCRSKNCSPVTPLASSLLALRAFHVFGDLSK
jgi:hypothetical protein